MDRILWYFNVSAHENYQNTIQRAEKFLDSIDHTQDILVISHGIFLKVLINRLEHRGYVGGNSFFIKNGYLYRWKLNL